MKEIYYLTSKGVRINLIQEPYMMLEETDLFDYTWEPISSGENFPKIKGMKKGFVSPQFTIDVSGSTESEFANNLENLISSFDGDVYRNEMGRLYIGNNYRNCFIQGATFPKVFKTKMASVGFTTISDVADWVEWETVEFEGAGDIYSTPFPLLITDFTPSNNGSTLSVETNNDGSSNVKWTNGENGGNIVIDLRMERTIESINELTFYRSTLGPAEVKIQISSDGTTYTDIGTLDLTNYGSFVRKTFNYNEPLTFRYLKIVNTGTVPVWRIDSPNLALYHVEVMGESLLQSEDDIETMTGMVIDMWESHMMQFHLTDDVGEFTIDCEHLGSLYINAYQNDVDITVSAYYEGEWHTIANGTQTVTLLNPNLYCEQIKVEFTGSEFVYFMQPATNLAIVGTKHHTLTNNSYAPTNAIIRIGESDVPSVIIGENTYGADVIVEEGQFLEIDTKEHTVRLYEEDGMTYENVYDKRTDGCFEKIESGENSISWFGNAEIEVLLEKGRSTPKWN